MSGNLGILLSQRSCCGITRICKRLFAGGVSILIQTNKGMLGHIHFASNLKRKMCALVSQARKAGGGKRARNIFDGERVCRNVFSRSSITASSTSNKLPFRIRQRNTQPVNFKLAGIGNRMRLGSTEGFIRSSEPCVELLKIHCIVNRIHPSRMGYRLKLFGHIAAHTLRIALGHYQFRMSRFYSLELNEQAVKLRIRKFRSI